MKNVVFYLLFVPFILKAQTWKWASAYSAAPDFIETPSAIGGDTAGNVYVFGHSGGMTSGYHPVYFKYNTQGALVIKDTLLPFIKHAVTDANGVCYGNSD